jgi:chemotaxis protein CheX
MFTAVMIDDMDQLVTSAITGVFATMLKIPIQKEPPGSPIRNGEAHVAGSVGFIGALSGVVYVYSTVSFAQRITKAMVGLKEADTGDEMVNDAIGEISNMIVGNIKSRLADRGLGCILTIPSIVRGSHFTIEPISSMQRRVSSFECDGNQVVVEVLLKLPKEASFAV